MRKCIAWLLMMAVLLTMAAGAYAQEPVMMAGFDDESTGHEWETNGFFQKMQEMTGISFVFSQYGNYEEWTAAKAGMLAGDVALPDVLFKAHLSTAETMAWYEQGKLIDLKPLMEENAPNLWALLQANPDWEKAITLPDGAIVALPSINELQNNNAMWINTTWLDNIGMEMPTTVEELTEVLRAFRDRDANFNGKQDEVPLTFIGMWDLKFLGHAFGVIANDYGVTMDEDGAVREMLTSDNNRAFLTWLNQLWEEGLLDENGFMSTDSLRQITDADATIPYGMMFAATPLSVVPSEKLGEYAMLMPLRYEGEQKYRDLTGDIIRGAFAITSACKDPVAMLKWVDFLYTEEGYRLAQAGTEGEHYVWNEDGTWTWLGDSQTVAMTVLQEVTILEGGTMPGLCSIPFQQAYEEATTAAIIEQMYALKQHAVQPYPLVYLSEEQSARIAEIWADAGYYAEYTMANFVTGDIELNDDTWNEFCQTLNSKGLQEMVALWQEAAK